MSTSQPASSATAVANTAVVFIDRSLPEFEQLVAAVDPGAEVVLLDTSRDGLQQIAQALAGRSGIDAIHILSHGSAGALELGNAHVTLDSLATYGEAFDTIRAALAKGADLLLYGCDVAQGTQGQVFIEALAAATGADVAASIDLTGSALLGGDWDLERTVGRVETASLGSGGVLAAYQGQLGIVSGEPAPTVSAIAYMTSATGVTNADTLVYQVTFSQTVENVDATDFTVAGPTGSAIEVERVDDITFEVKVANGNLASYNGAVTLGFAANHDIVDQAGQPLDLGSAPAVNQVTYQLDNNAPTVASIVRNAAAATNADSLTWTVTFSESVQDIGASDFSVSGTTATVTNVTGSGTTYQVTVSGGDLDYLDGQVTLGFAGAQDIGDGAGNALVSTTPTGTSQPTYTLDNTAPSFVSATVNGDKLVLTYSEALDPASTPSFMDFVVGYGNSAANVIDANVNGAAGTVTLTLDTPVPPGVAVSVAYNDPDSGGAGAPIRDRAGNAAHVLLPTNVVNDTPAANHAPTIRDYFSTSVSTGVASALPDYLVGDVDGDNLTVTLTASNGIINGVTDADGNPANGIQLQGSASVINTTLAQATFTATHNGTASVGISVTDGKVGTPVTVTSYLAATSPAPSITDGAVAGAAMSIPDRTALVAGADGNMYMAIVENDATAVSIYKWNGSAWSTTATALNAADLGYDQIKAGVTLGVDQYGKIHALAVGTGAGVSAVSLAVYDTTSATPAWEVSAIESGPASALISVTGASIVVTSNNVVNISYHRHADQSFDLAKDRNILITNQDGLIVVVSSDVGDPSVKTLQQFTGPNDHSYVLQTDPANGRLVLNDYVGGNFQSISYIPTTAQLVGAATASDGTIIIVTGGGGDDELLTWVKTGNDWVAVPVVANAEPGHSYFAYGATDTVSASGRSGLVQGMDGKLYLAIYVDDGSQNYTSKLLRLDNDGWVDGRTDRADFNLLESLSFAVDASGNVMIVDTLDTSADVAYIFGHNTDFEAVAAPAFVSATVDGATLTMSYDKALDVAHLPAAAAFAVQVDTAAVIVTGVAIGADGKSIVLTLETPALQGQPVTVAYTDPSGGNDEYAIQDVSGNDAASLVNQPVTNNSGETLAPTLASAVVTGTSLVLTYNEALDSHAPMAGSFSVIVAGSPMAVTNVTVDASTGKVTLTLASAVQPDQPVTVSYADASSGAMPIQDAAGNDAANLVNQVVTNRSVDTLAPALVSATVSGNLLALTYSEALDAAHGPAAAAFAVNVGGSQVEVSAVAVDAEARTVTLTLASSVQQGQPVTVSYTDPTGEDDDHAIQDAAGNDAASVTAHPVTNNTPASGGGGTPPVTPPVTPPAGVTVDGVRVVTEQVRNADGTTSTKLTIPVVTASRNEQVGNNDVADIPLAKDAAGNNLLLAQLPVGFGMTSLGSGIKTAGDALTDLIREIKAHTAAGSADQDQLAGGGTGFLGDLASSTNLIVQTIVPTFAGTAAPGAPLAITGLPSAPGNPLTALVLDGSALPAGTQIKLDNVEFAALIGAVNVSGGAGAQKVWGDSASQTIFLGEGDDVLHGGGGNDIVGSAGGNDRVYGDDGDDIVFGGEGDDYVDGGAGHDIARYSGAGREGYSLRVKDGQLIMKDLHGTDGTDTVVDVEVLRFTGAPADTTVRGTESRLVEAASGTRANDAAIDLWVDALDKGADQAAVARGLLAANGLDQLGHAGFIDALYHNVLGRDTDAAGKAFWVAALDAGRVDQAGAALLIADSAEKLALGQEVDLDFNHSDVATLVRMYETLFARHADEGGLNFWIGLHESGTSMTQLADYFVASGEAAVKYGALTDAQFVDALYLSAFERVGSAGEQKFWLDGLASGQLDRGDVLMGFAESEEMLTLVGTINTSITTV